MDMRVGLLFLIVLGVGLASAARQMVQTEFSDNIVVVSNIPLSEKDNQASDEVVGNDHICTLCEEFAAEALDYITENKTQTEIIDILHMACSRVPSFKQQIRIYITSLDVTLYNRRECITLVDYYAPLFFLEVSSQQPEAFCRKVNLCRQIVYMPSKLQEDRCRICHQAVSEVLIKLKNPDTQLEIIELLLKSCDSMENYAAKCKRLVFEYGPFILTNAEQFLETRDICTVLHACDTAKAKSGETETALRADS